MSDINFTFDALEDIMEELTRIEFNIGAVNQAVANINRNMINYQYALNNINNNIDEHYYNISNILPPPIFEAYDDEPTIMDGILAEEEARREDAARVIQAAWISRALYD